MLDVSDCRIIIVGGGSVAARKAAGLIAAGATDIRVIAPGFPGDFSTAVTKVSKRYEPGDLRDCDLVFAATDSALINDQIVRNAREIGAWVNRVDGSDETPGDFSNPAVLENGPVTVTVSAGSAALSTVIRNGIRDRMDPSWTEMAKAMQLLRPLIKAQEPETVRRAELFRSLATPEAFEVLRLTGVSGLKDWVFPVKVTEEAK